MNRYAQLLSATRHLLQSALIKIDKGHIFYATVFAELATDNLCIISNFTIPQVGHQHVPQDLCDQTCPECRKPCFGVHGHLTATKKYHACDSGHAWHDGHNSCLPEDGLIHLQVTPSTD